MAGVGAVHGYAEQQGEVPFEPGRVVGQQVREGRVGNEGTDLADHPRPGQQLLGQRGRRGVAHGDQRQPGPGVAGDDTREQGQVVLDDRRVDGHRRHVDELEPWLSKQQEHEEIALLQGAVRRTGTGPPSGRCDIDGTTTTDSRGLLARIDRHTAGSPCWRRSKASLRSSSERSSSRVGEVGDSREVVTCVPRHSGPRFRRRPSVWRTLEALSARPRGPPRRPRRRPSRAG